LSPDPGKSGTAVRALAARLNARVVAGGASLQALAGLDAELPERDRPLLKAMLKGSLRWHHRLDWTLSRLLDRPLKQGEAELGALLRIGLTQLEVLSIPDHAAVSATVGASARLGLGRARGLVNAVLRRYLRERTALAAAEADDEVALFSHPRWLIDALKRDWPADWRRILEAGNALPPLWLRVNRRAISREAYLASLSAAGFTAEASPVLEDAILMAEPCPVEALPGFAAGQVSVQDAAAQMAPGLMRLAPGLRVLDACAAPGGKTAHMLEVCPDLAELVALDSDELRLARIASNLTRLGLAGARLVHGDAREPEAWSDGARFDRILVDAPCSAAGVIRRHPDIKVLRRAGDPIELARDQARLLDALWPLLSPGGRLVYATCSVLRCENFGVIEAFAARTPDAELAAFGGEEHFQVLPGQANMDGFYYACLSKGGGGH
jgi:16S rRNA (cytosine967-C5)-methyltransferase